MPITAAQSRASAKYNKSHTKQYNLRYSLQYDADIIEALDAIPNKQGYIKALIRADIARAKSEPTTETTRAISDETKGENTMNSRIAICTINHNTEDTHLTISYDPARKAIFCDTPGEEDTPIAENLPTIDVAEDMCEMLYSTPAWELEWIERDDQPAQNILKEDKTMTYNAVTEPNNLFFDHDPARVLIRDDQPAQNPDDPGVPSGGNPWYAVLATSEDDWSKGSFDLDEAKSIAREIRKKHPGAMIAVIDNSLDYPFCSDTITDF